MARYESLPQEAWDRDVDVLVIGFGGAGGCAAIEACDAGADVLVLEKQPVDSYYSNTRISGGGFHSPDPAGDREALKEYSLAMFSGDNLPWKLEGELPADIAEGLAEAWAEYAPENEAWMKHLDPDFETVLEGRAAFPTFPGAEECEYRVVRATYSGGTANKEVYQKDLPKSEKVAGEAFYTCLQHGVDERDIEIHWNMPADEFIVDESGAVRGVVVQTDGERRTYRAKATVLTTGGFEYNEDLRLNFLEGPGVEGWAFYSNPANTGDGIVMSIEIGASLSKVSKAASRMITAIPLRKHGLKMGLRTPVVGRRNAIVVDNNGKRYASERTITKDPSRYFFYKKGVVFDIEELVYPRIPSWLVFDETLRKQRSVVGTLELGYHGIEWGPNNEKAIQNGWILEAESIEALAEEMQEHPDNRRSMDPDTLVETVSVYNGYCDAGWDESFGNDPANMAPLRTPPYYAIPLYPGGPNTKGGIMANAKREVLDADREPILNLYTAGEISSAFKFVYQGGGNLAECITFGRIAGQNAAKRAAEQQ